MNIFVVDDHSIDRTPEILAKYPKVQAVRYPIRERRGYDRIGKLLNTAIEAIPKTQYYMISGDDTYFPPNYVEVMIKNMIKEGVSIASGYARKFNPKGAPEGSGRIFTAEIWSRLTPFSETIVWESIQFHKARYMGFKFKKYPVKKIHLRKHTKGSLRTNGHASYTLGNPLLWTITRVIKDIYTRNKKPRDASLQLIGHLEYMVLRKPKADIAKYVYINRLREASKFVVHIFLIGFMKRLLRGLGIWKN
jgi:glycosyltransferase involved in cell wall biosynthesis